jgi:hypothetical protein
MLQLGDVVLAFGDVFSRRQHAGNLASVIQQERVVPCNDTLIAAEGQYRIFHVLDGRDTAIE